MNTNPLSAYRDVPRLRGKYECDTHVNALGLLWDCRVTYDFHRAHKGHHPKGDRFPIEPDEPASVSIYTVELTGLDAETFKLPILIDESYLEAGELCDLEDACLEDQRGRQEAADEWRYDSMKEGM